MQAEDIKQSLQPGQALILIGKQGSGKTILAREIAASYGSFSEIDHRNIGKNTLFNNALVKEPQTLIVDGFPKNNVIELKEMLTSNTIDVRRKGLPSKSIKTPNFIFCTCDAKPIKAVATERRFLIVEVK